MSNKKNQRKKKATTQYAKPHVHKHTTTVGDNSHKDEQQRNTKKE
jgi:hypothetical protein